MYDCLFNDEISHRLRNLLLIYRRRYASTIKSLQNGRVNDDKRFFKESGRPNLLTFLYWSSDREDEANKLNELTLLKYPNNLSASAAKTKLTPNDASSAMTNETLSVCDELVCEGELAYALRFLGPPFYTEAIERYDWVLAKYWQLDGTDQWALQEVMNRWCYYRAQTYNRIIFPGFLRNFDVKRITLKDVFRKIVEGLQFPMEGEETEFKARALVELVDAHSKCNTRDKSIQLPDDEDPDELLRRALRISPRDPYVIKQCGKLYMIWSAENSIMRARLLKQAIEVYEKYTGPRDRMIQFQMGRAYRFIALVIQPVLSKPEETENYLQNAEALLKSTMDDDGNNWKSMTELAMTYSFLKQHNDAEHWFHRAERSLQRAEVIDDDYEENGQFLYSNWALFRCFWQLTNTELIVNQHVLPLFREAIQLMLRSRKKEHHSKTLRFFYRKLSESFHQDRENSILRLENVLWSPIVDQYKNYERPIHDFLKQNQQYAAVVRSIVSSFMETGTDSITAGAVFLYLSVLFTCDLLDCCAKEDRRFAVNVARKVYHGMSCTHPTYPAVNSVARDTFRWLVGSATISSRGFPDAESSAAFAREFTENDEVDVCVIKLADKLTDLEGHLSVAAFNTMLENHLGLHAVCVGLSSSSLLSDVVEIVARSKSLIIIETAMTSSSLQKQLDETMFDRLPSAVVVVRVVVVDLERPDTDEYDSQDVSAASRAVRWPILVLNDRYSESSSMAFSLLDAISQWSYIDCGSDIGS